ncbi:MAG: LysR family transcriptional regulator [Bradyrhizobium sp.]|nr:MAG: LysR family transcriptional regulator [Bradyrhizobium sp.]
MMKGDPPWDALRSFGEVMRDGSLSGAARRLGLTQPTIGRHIDALEAAFGVALFARSPRGLSATQAALDLAPHVAAMTLAAQAAQRAASGDAAQEHGVVRVTASHVIGCEVLPRILAGFSAAHPGVTLELALNDRNEDLARREADIAVRMVRPTQSALVARRLGRTMIGLFAHRDYLALRGTPQSIADLAGHSVIGFDRDDSAFRSVGASSQGLSRDAFRFRCDSDLGQIAALRAGLGIGGCQEGIARRTRDLAPVLPGAIRFGLEMWLAMHQDLKANRRVRLLYDWLAGGLTDYLRGRGDWGASAGR